MASSFSSSDAELRSAGFLSRARSRKDCITGLQSSAMSSKGGACLWICLETDRLSLKKRKTKLALPNNSRKKQLCRTEAALFFQWPCEQWFVKAVWLQ